MFCDQDDVWLPDKIATTLQPLRDVERKIGADRPVLVHTDLMVVDESLRTLGTSFWKYQHLDPHRGSRFNRLLVQNVVTGCTVMANRALVKLARPIPPDAVMHDWWLALVAAGFGQIKCLDRQTVLYRQHGRNRIGAVRFGLGHVLRKLATFFDRSQLVRGMRETQRQARAFLEQFGVRLSAEKRSAVEAYVRLGECGFVSRRWYLVRYGFYPSGWIRNLSLLARL
jgi:hypothetical protein